MPGISVMRVMARAGLLLNDDSPSRIGQPLFRDMKILQIERQAFAAAEAAGEPPASLAAVLPDRRPPLKEAEEALIDEALTRAADNQGVAAGILRMPRQALNKRLGCRKLPTEPKA
jgi:hypothetical protein